MTARAGRARVRARARARLVVRLVAAVVVMALGAGACSIETAGAPRGDVSLTATFADAQDLTPGHNVQASNVVVGSVRAVRLHGYEAAVEISIVDGFRVPTGTEAVIRRTSLLGEHYVDLVLPDRFDPEAGPFLADGDSIDATSAQPDVEQLAEQAATVIGSLTADDLAATLDAAATGLGGRGSILEQLLADAGLVAGALADQQHAIASAVDDLGRLGRTLAPRSEALTATLDRLAEASGTLAERREGIVAAVEALVRLATETNETVLEPHAERLARLLADLRPTLGSLADESAVLADLMVDLDRFVAALPTAVHNGNVLLQAWFHVPTALQELGNLEYLPLGELLRTLGITGGQP